MNSSRYSVQTTGHLAESFSGLEAWRANTLTTQEGVTGLPQMIAHQGWFGWTVTQRGTRTMPLEDRPRPDPE
jgi:hypothetical protein